MILDKKETESAKKRDRQMLVGCLINYDNLPPKDMNLTVSAALVFQNITSTPFERLEGMQKCHDGLVAAGTALLEEDEKH